MSRFDIKSRRRNIPEKELLDDLRHTASKLRSNSLTHIQYDELGNFGATTILRRFGKWNNALKAAGLSINNRQDITDEELFENLAAVWTKLGKQPFGRHMSDKFSGSEFSLGTYEKRFGSWNNSLVAFGGYIAGTGSETQKLIPNSKTRTADGNSTPRNVNWRLRAKILIRDNCICKMCGDSPAKNADCVLHVDHIIAWSNGGETKEENLQTLCEVCNIGKSNAF